MPCPPERFIGLDRLRARTLIGPSHDPADSLFRADLPRLLLDLSIIAQRALTLHLP